MVKIYFFVKKLPLKSKNKTFPVFPVSVPWSCCTTGVYAEDLDHGLAEDQIRIFIFWRTHVFQIITVKSSSNLISALVTLTSGSNVSDTRYLS